MKKESFGVTSNGKEAALYTIEAGNIRVTVSDFGATLVSVFVKDRDGNEKDVILGYDTAAEFESNKGNFGGLIGRYANRTADGKYTLNGIAYQMELNDGKNNCHSGPDGYQYRYWNPEEQTDSSVKFSLKSPDGDQHFPGNAVVSIRYSVTDKNELILDYHGECDQDTIMNLTNHAYFNLNGHETGSIENHKVQIFADAFTPIDETSIPTGEILPVEGTNMDFRTPEVIGARIDADDGQLKNGNGYDHNYAVSKDRVPIREIAKAWGDRSGIEMTVESDLPGVQFYTGNFITDRAGKGGARYGRRHGFCFETQYYPDSINNPAFTRPLLAAGDQYVSRTIYRFS